MTESLATTAGRAGLGQTWTDVHTVGPDLTKVNLDSFTPSHKTIGHRETTTSVKSHNTMHIYNPKYTKELLETYFIHYCCCSLFCFNVPNR